MAIILYILLGVGLEYALYSKEGFSWKGFWCIIAWPVFFMAAVMLLIQKKLKE